MIDLKIGDLIHQYIGQMQIYVNCYDRQIKLEDENRTIGLILCQDKCQVVVEYTLPEKYRADFCKQVSDRLTKQGNA